MLIPVTTLNTNQVKGLIKIECIRTTIEAIEAKAANTRICPTLEISPVIVFAPIKYPT
jgi:hypothetical protein